MNRLPTATAFRAACSKTSCRSPRNRPVVAMRVDNLADLLLDSPFAGSELDLERIQDFPRPLKIE